MTIDTSALLRDLISVRDHLGIDPKTISLGVTERWQGSSMDLYWLESKGCKVFSSTNPVDIKDWLHDFAGLPSGRVRVYFNLHKDLFSVKDHTKGSPTKGKVIKHTDLVMLKDVKFVVSEAGRQRVLDTKRKAVHAYVEGTVIRPGDKLEHTSQWYTLQQVTYNPYKAGYFYDKTTGERMDECTFITCLLDDETGRPKLLASVPCDFHLPV